MEITLIIHFLRVDFRKGCVVVVSRERVGGDLNNRIEYNPWNDQVELGGKHFLADY